MYLKRVEPFTVLNGSRPDGGHFLTSARHETVAAAQLTVRHVIYVISQIILPLCVEQTDKEILRVIVSITQKEEETGLRKL